MAKHILGMASIELGEIAGDGGISTTFASIGDTVPGSVVFSTADGTTQDFFTEESDVAIESVKSQPGTTTLAWSTNNVEADVMIQLFGGAKTGSGPVIYSPPDTAADVELSAKVTDKKGNILAIVRASMKPKLSLNFSKTALGQIDIVATVLTPTKAATKPWTFSTPTA